MSRRRNVIGKNLLYTEFTIVDAKRKQIVTYDWKRLKTKVQISFFYVVSREYLWYYNNIFSGDSYEAPPVPISNTVVKLVNVESTCLETDREDRKSLID